jgi:hypothetical protein
MTMTIKREGPAEQPKSHEESYQNIMHVNASGSTGAFSGDAYK